MSENTKSAGGKQPPTYTYTEVVTNTVFEVVSSGVFFLMLYQSLVFVVDWKLKNNGNTSIDRNTQTYIDVATNGAFRFICLLSIYKLGVIFKRGIHKYYPKDTNETTKFILSIMLYMCVLIGLMILIIYPILEEMLYDSDSYNDFQTYLFTLEGLIIFITIMLFLTVLITMCYKTIVYMRHKKFFYSKTSSEQLAYENSLITYLEYGEEYLLLLSIMVSLLNYTLALLFQKN